MSEPEGNANDTLFDAPMGEQERMIEAILFASADPVSVKELNDRTHGCDAARPWCICKNAMRGAVSMSRAWARHGPFAQRAIWVS